MRQQPPTPIVFQEDQISRRNPHDLTFSLMNAFSENLILPLWDEEVVLGKGSLCRKMAGDGQLMSSEAILAPLAAVPDTE